MMQTILGAGGVIGKETARSLTEYTNEIRLVSRHPKKVNPGDECISADLLKKEEVFTAVEGSEVVYLVAGLKYNAKSWEKQWPIVMQNTIEACLQHDARLVFFDNIYMYDPGYLGDMNEDTPMAPVSRKGKVRAFLVEMLERASQENGLKYLIARSADFYGPGNTNSVLVETVFKPLAKGSKANCLGDPERKHTYTYTPDAGRATAFLGNTPVAFGDTWHLPTAPPLTGEEWIHKIAGSLGKDAKFRAVSRSMVRLMGLFISPMRESVEMMYQFENDYVFNSSKIEERFGLRPTPVEEAIEHIVKTDFS